MNIRINKPKYAYAYQTEQHNKYYMPQNVITQTIKHTTKHNDKTVTRTLVIITSNNITQKHKQTYAYQSSSYKQ